MDQFAECLRYAVTKCCRGRHETRAYRCRHLQSSKSGDFYTQSVLHNLTGFSRFSSPRDFQGQDHIRLPQAAGCRDIKCWYKNPLLGTPERILNISGHTEEMLTPYIFLLQTRNSTNSRECVVLFLPSEKSDKSASGMDWSAVCSVHSSTLYLWSLKKKSGT